MLHGIANAASAKEPQEWDPEQLAAERAQYYYSHGANCAESVLMALPEALARADLAVDSSVAAGWAGGIGDKGCLCGALAGAIMVAGVCADRVATTRRARAKIAAQLAADIKKAFDAHFESSCCRTIRRRLSPEAPESTRHCGEVTAEAARLAAAVLRRCAAAGAEADSQAQISSDDGGLGRVLAAVRGLLGRVEDSP